MFHKQPSSHSVVAAAAAMHEGQKKKSTGAGQKRGWEPWSAKEIHSFFEALEKQGRDFEQIQTAVGTKQYQQVRHFYYRLLKKINKLLQPSGIVVDKKSATEISMALHCYWEVKKKMNALHPETANESSVASALSAHNAEFTRDFTALVRENIVAKRGTPQAQNGPPPVATVGVAFEIEALDSQSHPHEVLSTIQLLPRNDDVRDWVQRQGFNPRLQLSLNGDRPISAVLQHLRSKWGSKEALPFALKLYPSGAQLSFSERDVVVVSSIAAQQRTKLLVLEYSWDLTIKPTQQQPIQVTMPSIAPQQHTPQVSSGPPADISHFRSIMALSGSQPSKPSIPPSNDRLQTERTTITTLPSTRASSSPSDGPGSQFEQLISSVPKRPPGSFPFTTSSPFIDEISCDGFESTETVCDTDEKECKAFYSSFEDSNLGDDNSGSDFRDDTSLSEPMFKKPKNNPTSS